MMPAARPLATLGARLRAGETLFSGWCGIADPAVPELMVRSGFDTAVLDMQHGAFTLPTASAAIAAMALAGAPAVVRIPVGDFATASRLCDAGAAAIIAPMINSAADAAAFAAAVKYPPLGDRSWGPHRAVVLSGMDPQGYFQAANDLHLALPMIETRAALDALDAILALPGIDGVFVGPADLSVALGGDVPDPRAPEVAQVRDHIAARAAAAGKVAGWFCLDGQEAKAMSGRGFRLCSIGIDGWLLGSAVRAECAAAR